MIDLTARPLLPRAWRTYRNYRLALNRWDALTATCWLLWMNRRKGRKR